MTETGVLSLLGVLVAGVFVALMEFIDMRTRGFKSTPERWFLDVVLYCVAAIVIGDVYFAKSSARPEWLDQALIMAAVGTWIAAMIALVRMTARPSR